MNHNRNANRGESVRIQPDVNIRDYDLENGYRPVTPKPNPSVSAAQQRREAQRERQRQKLADQQKLVFTAIFLVSLIVISPFLVRGMVQNNRQQKAAEAQQAKNSVAVTAPAQESGAAASVAGPVDKEHFFDNALFIGDSRTVGLKDYGGIDKGVFFADVGTNTAKVATTPVKVKGYGTVTLNSVLNSKSFDRIYVCIGINEVGNEREGVLKDFGALLDLLQEKQPDAQIIVEGNLHVTEDKSNSDKVINNRNLDSLNAQMAKVARSKNCRYLDPNVCFDDGKGNLKAEVTGDKVHLLGKYYEIWRNWLIQQG